MQLMTNTIIISVTERSLAYLGINPIIISFKETLRSIVFLTQSLEGGLYHPHGSLEIYCVTCFTLK